MPTGSIYKLHHRNPEAPVGFYIGSSWNPQRRASHHKEAYSHGATAPIYAAIAKHGGWDYWRMTVLESDDFADLTARRIREQQYIDRLKPALNVRPAYATDAQKKAVADAWHEKVATCPCGATLTQRNMAAHRGTVAHVTALESARSWQLHEFVAELLAPTNEVLETAQSDVSRAAPQAVEAN